MSHAPRRSLRMGWGWLAAATVAGCAAAAKPEPPPPTRSLSASVAALAWLAGPWSGEVDGAHVEELWMAPLGGTMVGSGRTTAATGAPAGYEFLRIAEADGRIVYFAQPGGRAPATPFWLVDAGATRARFENPGHDFPQVIVYERRGDDLEVGIEGPQAGEWVQWRWTLRRAPSQPSAPAP